MEFLRQDLRLGLRQAGASPGFTLVAVVTLALAIGANTTIVSLIDATYLRRLAVPNDRIVHVQQRIAGRSDAAPLSMVDYTYYREHARGFEALAAHYPNAPLHAVIRGESVPLTGSVVTSNYFDVLGLAPRVGHFFSGIGDDALGGEAAAIISDALWRRRFGADPAAVGEVIRLNGRAFTIAGVAPGGFDGVIPGGDATAVWIPASSFDVGYRYCNAFERGCTIVQMLGRLRAGVSVDQVQAELDTLANQLETAFPSTNRDRSVVVSPARGVATERRAALRPLIRILSAVSVTVLVIACANLAGLLLARGLGRRKEIAIRLALGVPRRRLVRQLLMESAILSVAGGAGGLFVALWGQSLLLTFYAADYAGRPANFTLTISLLALAATVGVTACAGVTFGLIPALRASREDPVRALRTYGAGAGSPARLHHALVIAQVALSLMLLVGAGLLVRSVARVYRGPVPDPGALVLLRVRPSLTWDSTERARAFQDVAIRRIEDVPGVVSASLCDYIPVLGTGEGVSVETPGGARTVLSSRIGPRFFATLGVQVLEGREFDSRDSGTSRPVVVLNTVLATQLWPGQATVGRALVIDGVVHDVVGVVGDARYYTAAHGAEPYLYRSYAQPSAEGRFASDSRIHVRVSGDPRIVLGRIRSALMALNADVPVSEDYPLVERVAYEFRSMRMVMVLLMLLGGLALILSAMGIYGVVATAARQRSREMAIRMALGARRTDVGGLVIRQMARLALAGTALGLAGAAVGAKYLAASLYGVGAFDALSYTVAPAILVSIALAASYVPTRRVMRVDPTTVLRGE